MLLKCKDKVETWEFECEDWYEFLWLCDVGEKRYALNLPRHSPGMPKSEIWIEDMATGKDVTKELGAISLKMDNGTFTFNTGE